MYEIYDEPTTSHVHPQEAILRVTCNSRKTCQSNNITYTDRIIYYLLNVFIHTILYTIHTVEVCCEHYTILLLNI